MKDKQGRTYVKLSNVRAGDILLCDSDFSCMRSWSKHKVYQAKTRRGKSGLYVRCVSGQHFLDGQLSFRDHESLIGLYRPRELKRAPQKSD